MVKRKLICAVAACGRPVRGKGYKCIDHAPDTRVCVVCGSASQGYFCSNKCDTGERLSRLAHKLVVGLRRLAA